MTAEAWLWWILAGGFALVVLMIAAGVRRRRNTVDRPSSTAADLSPHFEEELKRHADVPASRRGLPPGIGPGKDAA